MKRNLLILGLALMIVCAGGEFSRSQEIDTMTVRAEATRNDSVLTHILIDQPFNIDIYMNNRDTVEVDPSNGWRLSYSMPFVFYSPGNEITTVTHIDSGGGSSPDGLPNLVVKNGFADYWNMIWWVTTWSWDGSLPDTINLTGIASGGWPNNLGEELYLRFTFQISQTGVFCIDSIDHPNDTYDWLLDPPSPPFRGPYCWNVTDGSDVEENTGSQLLPNNFELSQNYPNPFNPSTVIDFALPTKADVSLTVFNILGQRIKTLVNGEYAAGYHTTVWDGTNENGSPAASGIYFYKITADKYTNTKKLMLLK